MTDMKLWLEIFRRFAAISSVVLWLGGFTFYAGVVVPVGGKVLGHHKQGLVTQQVTGWLNLIGVLSLIILLWNLLQNRRTGRWVTWGLLLTWLGMALIHVGLFILHPILDRMIGGQGGRIAEFDRFESLHALYGAISTAQWALGVLYVVILLYAWTQPESRFS